MNTKTAATEAATNDFTNCNITRAKHSSNFTVKD